MPEDANENLSRALGLLQTIALVDGHNDLPYLIRRETAGDLDAFDLRTLHVGRDTDIPRLRAGLVSGQFWAAFTPARESRPASFALQQIALIRRLATRFPDVFLDAYCSSHITEAKRQGRIASFIAIENGAAIEEDRLDSIDSFHALGVRLITLCHNLTTNWCDSATDRPRHDGLSLFGRKAVERMNRLGVMVDLAHTSDRVMHQVLDQSAAPVVWSHSNARRICDHRRNIPDDVLARVPENGGVVMATFVPDFLSQRSHDWLRPLQDEHSKSPASVDMDAAIAAQEKAAGAWPRGGLSDLCNQIDYLAATIGADHVGIGSDFFGGPQGEGLKDASCFPHIFAELMRRGWSDDGLAKLASGNIVRVMRAVEDSSRA